jgi:hypothetical protein
MRRVGELRLRRIAADATLCGFDGARASPVGESLGYEMLCLQVWEGDERQRNEEGGALLFGGLEPDAATVSFDEFSAEVKP